MRTVIVAAGILIEGGKVLLSRRKTGTHLAGLWEFPGGKCDANETLKDGLARELLEELDVLVRIGEEMLTTTHAYPDRLIELHFFRCELLGEARPVLEQEMQWVRREDLAALEFPPADAELIAILMEPLG